MPLSPKQENADTSTSERKGGKRSPKQTFHLESAGTSNIEAFRAKRLANEHAPSRWVLPEDIDSKTKHAGAYPRAGLLGVPTELRQTILLMSYDVKAMLNYETQGTEPWKRPRKYKSRISISVPLERAFTNLEQAAIEKLSERIVQLCQVSEVLRDDMQYVGKLWQEQMERLLYRKVEIDVPKFPIVLVPRGPMYRSSRQKSVVIEGDDKPLKGRRPGKCWDCTERYVPGRSECPRAIEDSQRWLRETKVLGGWRSGT